MTLSRSNPNFTLVQFAGQTIDRVLPDEQIREPFQLFGSAAAAASAGVSGDQQGESTERKMHDD